MDACCNYGSLSAATVAVGIPNSLDPLPNPLITVAFNRMGNFIFKSVI